MRNWVVDIGVPNFYAVDEFLVESIMNLWMFWSGENHEFVNVLVRPISSVRVSVKPIQLVFVSLGNSMRYPAYTS